MVEETEETLELGTFEVRSSDGGGEEVRLTDTRNHSNIVLRKKTVGREMQRGAKYSLTATLISTQEDETVTVEMPADETAGLTPSAKIVEEGGEAKRASKKGK